jgi:hypothetical protein
VPLTTTIIIINDVTGCPRNIMLMEIKIVFKVFMISNKKNSVSDETIYARLQEFNHPAKLCFTLCL